MSWIRAPFGFNGKTQLKYKNALHENVLFDLIVNNDTDDKWCVCVWFMTINMKSNLWQQHLVGSLTKHIHNIKLIRNMNTYVFIKNKNDKQTQQKYVVINRGQLKMFGINQFYLNCMWSSCMSTDHNLCAVDRRTKSFAYISKHILIPCYSIRESLLISMRYRNNIPT